MQCRVSCCGKLRDKKNNVGLRIFECPNDKEIRQIWIKACGPSCLQFKALHVCSDHFVDDAYEQQARMLGLPFNKWHLKRTATPTLNLSIAAVEPSPRDNRAKKRKIKETVSEVVMEYEIRKSLEAKGCVDVAMQTTYVAHHQ